MHDKATWQQMEQIERQTGKQIVRIETNDLDAMEEVRPFPLLVGAAGRSPPRDLLRLAPPRASWRWLAD